MPETIGDLDVGYALDIVKTICSQVGPGMPGSIQERERGEWLQKELETHLGAGNVSAEEFLVAPWAWLSSYPISALMLMAAALLNLSIGRFSGISPWLTAMSALAFSILAPLPFIFVFILNYEWFDRFFRKKRSANVIGTLRKPGTKNVKRLLILGGHHDSAPENTWLSLLGYGFIIATATWSIGFVIMLMMSIIQMAGTITGNTSIMRTGTLGWALLAYPIVPAVLFGLFFNRGRKDGGSVPGAADNLSACAIEVAMCRFLVRNPSCIPDDVEIRFIFFGSEEAGLRGSRHYVERHLDELKRLDARLLNFEVVAHPEIAILASDVNGTVRNSPEMVRSVIAAAERAEVPYTVKRSGIGVGSDAGPFSQAGLKAATLLPFKMPQQMVAFYHQKRDRPDVLAREPLRNVLRLTLEWVRCGGDQATP